MKHTQGEWIYWESHDEGLSISGKEDHHPVIAVTNPDLENEEANAKLIAAAPELLEAIHYYFSVLKEVNGESWNDGPDHVLSKMIEASKKATS